MGFFQRESPSRFDTNSLSRLIMLPAFLRAKSTTNHKQAQARYAADRQTSEQANKQTSRQAKQASTQTNQQTPRTQNTTHNAQYTLHNTLPFGSTFSVRKHQIHDSKARAGNKKSYIHRSQSQSAPTQLPPNLVFQEMPAEEGSYRYHLLRALPRRGWNNLEHVHVVRIDDLFLVHGADQRPQLSHSATENMPEIKTCNGRTDGRTGRAKQKKKTKRTTLKQSCPCVQLQQS